MNNNRIGKTVIAGGITTTEEYVYDGKNIALVYDGKNIALVFDGSGTQTHRYLYGVGDNNVLADETSTVQVLWALFDNEGTVKDVVDSNGTVLNHIVYDSFGNVTSQTNSTVVFRFGYTGQELDKETGLYYYLKKGYIVQQIHYQGTITTEAWAKYIPNYEAPNNWIVGGVKNSGDALSK